LVTPDEAGRIEALLQKLNPKAKIIRTSHADVPLTEILNTKRFNFRDAMLQPGWLQELRGEHTPESEEYGISSFVYRRRRPFHPERLHQLLSRRLPNVVRSKGNVWLAPLNDISVEWAGTGDIVSFAHGGGWLVSLEEHVRTLAASFY
jgi:G3E family GTPase